MATQNMFQNMQPWMDITSNAANKLFSMNAKTWEKVSNLNMSFASDCANIMSRCAQDLSNPKGFTDLPSRMTNEFNNLTHQVIEHNKKALELFNETSNQYRQFGQQFGEEIVECTGGSMNESKSSGSASKKVA